MNCGWPCCSKLQKQRLSVYRPRYTLIMRALLDKRDVTSNEVLASTNISQSSVSLTVKDMVKQGLVQMSSDEDVRERKVRQTRKGNRLLPKLKNH
nr:helix-turn-helix domain-containing protein [Microbulbifer okhotskensis]